jgi:D-lactate dehydrogenase (cytochrome)
MNKPPPAAKAPPKAALDAIKAIVGPKGWIDDPADMAPHLEEPRGLWHGRAAVVVKPASTAEVAAVMKVCDEHVISVVPQGGVTSLVGAAVPHEHGHEIVLSLSRMNTIRALDPLNDTMTVEAGCILANIQAAADEAGRLFPLSLGAEGTCQIGGNLSTNAGGTGVLRYGNARSLVLGLEVVLPSGEVWNGLRGLRKDNTGYDLKHLFLGAEGTLGIITAAVLKLFPKPNDTVTALVGLPDPQAAVDLLARTRAATGDAVSGFELMSRFCIEIATEFGSDVRDPFAVPPPQYLLIELTSAQAPGPLRGAFEKVLETAMEDGLVLDAVIADSGAQAQAIWRIREAVPEVQMSAGGSIKHDVSVPVSRIPEFIARADAAVTKAMPGVRPCAFGHVGDGNVHYNLSQPLDMGRDDFMGRWAEMNEIVHDIVAELGGSISAEHGLGRLKREEIRRYKSEIELEMMRAIKRTLDPKGIMNPGKVI